MNSLEELQKIKERVLQQRQMAGESARASVVVAMGTCSIAVGARDTMTAILSEIEKRDVSDVVVTQTGCMGLCKHEPIVQIQVGSHKPVTYGKIDPERVPALIERHVIGGEAVTEWLVK
jgi:NADP-reducing hydrogenase subunit HndB